VCHGVIDMLDAPYFCNKKENDMNKIFISFLGVFMLTLSACGGGSSSGTTGAANVTGLSGVVSLSGVVVNGTASGVAMGAVGSTTTVNGIYPNKLVIAMDKNGNVFTAITDKAGKFTLTGLQSGVSYAIRFVDPSSLKVLASLRQKASTSTAGAVALTANADLGRVLINPTSKKAVSESDINGTLLGSVNSAPVGMDANGDGIVSKQEITSIQANTINSGSTALTQVSMADFFGQPNQWTSTVTHSPTSDSYSLAIASTAKITGPQGSLVNAVKESDVIYYKRNINSTGYYTPNLGYTSTAYMTPPVKFNFNQGPSTSAAASYADPMKNLFHTLNTIGDTKVTWDQYFKYPLNFTLGKMITQNLSIQGVTFSLNLSMNLAQENGQPYILKTTDGTLHPVIKVDIKITGNSLFNSLLPKIPSQYLISGGGSFVNAQDTNGNIILPSQALKQVVFGQITSDTYGKFVSATNINPLAVNAWGLTTAQRNKMLAYIWNAKDFAGIMPKGKVGGAAIFQPYFYSNYDAYGNTAAPASWDSVTYLPKYLTTAATVNFTTNLNYATGANGVNFNLEFRQYDPATSTSVVIGSPSTSVAGAATNQVNTPLTVSGSLIVPTLASLNPANKYSYLDPVSNSTIAEGNAELWLIMKDVNGTVVMEQMLDAYLIH